MSTAQQKGAGKADQEAQQQQIVCRECGCHHFDTLHGDERRHNGRVRRKKACRNCGKTVTVYEAGD